MRGRTVIFLVSALGLASPAVAVPERRIAEPSTPEARATLDRAAACIANASPGVASDMLTMDFRTPTYRNKMDRLFEANRSCFKVKWLRTNRLLVAGAMAEHLLERDAVPLNTRLARVVATASAKPLTATDAAAFCVSRSDPDGSARLLASEPGGASETTAAAALGTALGRCYQGRPMLLSPAALRSMVATASFRLLAAGKS